MGESYSSWYNQMACVPSRFIHCAARCLGHCSDQGHLPLCLLPLPSLHWKLPIWAIVKKSFIAMARTKRLTNIHSFQEGYRLNIPSVINANSRCFLLATSNSDWSTQEVAVEVDRGRKWKRGGHLWEGNNFFQTSKHRKYQNFDWPGKLFKCPYQVLSFFFSSGWKLMA